MRITEKKLREMIRSKILREFLGQGASSGVGFPEPAYILKYKDLEPQIRKDFSTHDSCVTTRMGSLGSTIFASCPRSELVTPEALEALAQHVVS